MYIFTRQIKLAPIVERANQQALGWSRKWIFLLPRKS
jgi:hypothetical protein